MTGTNRKKIAFTGFMGVGKSSIAKHLAKLANLTRLDLDNFIEHNEGRPVSEILQNDGEAVYRSIETKCLQKALHLPDVGILSLGGGTWTLPENRKLISEADYVTVWLEAPFDHCWQNIRRSKKERPLAANKQAAMELFEKRRSVYCLADWHFIIRPGLNSYDLALQINEELFS